MARSADDIPDATLRLLITTGVGATTHARLRRHFGSDEAAVAASAAELARIKRLGPSSADALRRALDEADTASERRRMAECDTSLIVRGDVDYPALLDAIPDPPRAMWIRGRLETADCLAVAIVGARRCTAYGREQAGRFASLLAECGLTIVSGGAIGIDGEAHRGALRAGARTVAVLGCGLSVVYPSQHRELFSRIVDAGSALVSEYPMAMAPRPAHFPHRNRIISGLSVGVLVIEAARRSGALITARRAVEEHGREAMALPGRVDSPASAGCLAAIREGWAGLVTSHAEVLSQLDSSSHLLRGALEAAGHTDATRKSTLFDTNLTSAQQTIVETLRNAGEALLVDQIAARCDLPLSRILADLTLLEIRGHVRNDREGIRLKAEK
jgi:DNA processing protein